MTRAQIQRVRARRVDTSGGPSVQEHQELQRSETGSSQDTVLVEEPLEIHLDGDLVATTMRTPGFDSELAVGLLWAEGRIAGPPLTAHYCPERASPLAGPDSALCVQTGPTASDSRRRDEVSEPAGYAPGRPTADAPRLGLTSSSCGMCGVEQIETLVHGLDPIPGAVFASLDMVAALEAFGSGTDRSRQELFDLTGGCHAAAALDPTGSAIVVREDIGRHNAVDKVVGRLLLDGRLPLGAQDVERSGLPVLLWVSGRASFEIVQKAWAAGFPAVAAVGAVSALAVEVAERAGMMLLGFARDGRATAYTEGGSEPWMEQI